MTIAYRYRHLLDGPDDEPGSGLKYLIEHLMPAGFAGGHNPSIEIVEQSFAGIRTPETENHLLMIETSGYLFNQLVHEQTGDQVFADANRDMSRWLLQFLQTIAQHDFLEFAARPYARLSLHALLNLYEFASDPPLRTAAHNILDYTFTKFAVSASRGRRVNPFRRHQHRISHASNFTNFLYADLCDQVSGFFVAYTGMTNEHDVPPRFPDTWVFQALIAATSSYRPPVAAYMLALNQDVPPYLHRFYHGIRPKFPAGEIADPGVEIYYRSPSYMLTAGGCFLNSGYGNDEITIGDHKAFHETSRAQATTLIPTHALDRFSDLVRLDPYNDPGINPEFQDHDNGENFHTTAVNMGVNRGIAAGGNFRPAPHKVILEHFMSESPSLTTHNGQLYIAWRADDESLSVGRVVTATAMHLDGIEGLDAVTTVNDPAIIDFVTSDAAPALASHNGRLYLAWRGSGNEQLNLAFSTDDGAHWQGTTTLPETSDHAPALVSHAGRLYLAWTGRSNEKLNIAKVALFASTAGAFGIEGLEDHAILSQSSERGLLSR